MKKLILSIAVMAVTAIGAQASIFGWLGIHIKINYERGIRSLVDGKVTDCFGRGLCKGSVEGGTSMAYNAQLGNNNGTICIIFPASYVSQFQEDFGSTYSVNSNIDVTANSASRMGCTRGFTIPKGTYPVVGKDEQGNTIVRLLPAP